MVSHFGDYDTTETVVIPFNTFTSDDPSISATITNLVAGDVEIHKDGSTTQRASDNGVTVTIDFDTVTGNHIVSIDLSDNSDAGYYANGSRYQVRIEGTTVDGGTISAWIGTFSIGCTLRPTTAGAKLDVNATGEAGLDLDNTSGTIDAAQLGADCITAAKIGDDAIAAEHIAAGAIVAATFDASVDAEILSYIVDDATKIDASSINSIKAETAAILADTNEIGTAGAGLTDLGGMSDGMKAEVQSECNDALVATNLDHLCLTATAGADMTAEVADNTILARILADGDTSEFIPGSHGLEPIRVRGDAAWITGGGGGITDMLNVVPLIPISVDLANTATVRLGLALTNALDDLPSTAEITPGTIDIDRKAIGGTSWSSVVSGAACSEAAGMVYYDEVFDSGTGYAEGDSIRVTFKSQKITVAANDYELSDATGRMFYTYVRQTMRGTNDASLATGVNVTQVSGGSTAADNLEAMLDGTGATLTLTQLRVNANDANGGIYVTNSGGHAFYCFSTGGNGKGAYFRGNGSGEGQKNLGGNTNGAHGVYNVGGSGGGAGTRNQAQAGNSSGLLNEGFGGGAGHYAEGGATGHGYYGLGGATSGDGMHVEAQTAGDGIEAVGAGGGYDINANIQGTIYELGVQAKLDVNSQCDTAISDAALATAAALSTHDGKADAILLDTGTTLPGLLADGTVQVGTIQDGAIGAAAVADIFSTTTIAEAYAADGAAGTPAQILYMIQQAFTEFAISGTTMTVKKLDGSTTASTYTLNDGTTPTSRTRAS